MTRPIQNVRPLGEGRPAAPAGPRAASRPTRHDVVVVGGRVAGASTAMLLARRGLRVLLLERAPAPGTDTLSTLALMRAGVLQLGRWGLLGKLEAAGTPPVRQTVVHYGADAELVPIKEKAGVAALYAPRRTVLDAILVEAAAEAGAEVRFGAAVAGVVRERGRVAGVAGRDREGRDFEARASLVVGADGMSSVVARAVGAPTTWQGTRAGAFVYGFWSGLDVPGYEWFYRVGATAGIIPTNHGLHCVWVGAPPDRFRELSRDGLERCFDALLAEAAPETVGAVAAGRRDGRLRGFPGLPGHLRKPWGPGWALVGDAGSFRDPISAHGMTDALRDAELLARQVPAALADPAQEGRALAAYERRRDEAALPLAEITDAVASYRWSLPEVRELLLALSKAMSHEVAMLTGLDAPSAAAA